MASDDADLENWLMTQPITGQYIDEHGEVHPVVASGIVVDDMRAMARSRKARDMADTERPFWLDFLKIGERYNFWGEDLPYGCFNARVMRILPTGIWIENELSDHKELLHISGAKLHTAVIKRL
jgi:hypothetical protein